MDIEPKFSPSEWLQNQVKGSDTSGPKSETKKSKAIEWCDSHGLLKSRLIRQILGVDVEKICGSVKGKIYDLKTTPEEATQLAGELTKLMQKWKVSKVLGTTQPQDTTSPKTINTALFEWTMPQQRSFSHEKALGTQGTDSARTVYTEALEAAENKNIEALIEKNNYPIIDKKAVDYLSRICVAIPKDAFYFEKNGSKYTLIVRDNTTEKAPSRYNLSVTDDQLALDVGSLAGTVLGQTALLVKDIVKNLRPYDTSVALFYHEVGYLKKEALALKSTRQCYGMSTVELTEKGLTIEDLAPGKGIFLFDEKEKKLQFHYKDKDPDGKSFSYDLILTLGQNTSGKLERQVVVHPNKNNPKNDKGKDAKMDGKEELDYSSVWHFYISNIQSYGQSFSNALEGDAFLPKNT
jgi:hypothetical protein